MKIGQSVHIDVGSALGLALALIGSMPEAFNEIRPYLPEKVGHYLQAIAIIIIAMRGQVVRREQYRTDEVFSIPPTDLEKKDDAH